MSMVITAACRSASSGLLPGPRRLTGRRIPTRGVTCINLLVRASYSPAELRQGRLFQRDRADVVTLAGAAMRALPQRVELLHHRVDQARRLGPDTHLKIPPAR